MKIINLFILKYGVERARMRVLTYRSLLVLFYKRLAEEWNCTE